MKSVPKEVLMGYILMLRHRGVMDARVLNAMERIPRHEFVTENFLDRAYEDTALPTSAGQTLSQPSVVAKIRSCANWARAALTSLPMNVWPAMPSGHK